MARQPLGLTLTVSVSSAAVVELLHSQPADGTTSGGWALTAMAPDHPPELAGIPQHFESHTYWESLTIATASP
jgi:hypothetical protein